MKKFINEHLKAITIVLLIVAIVAVFFCIKQNKQLKEQTPCNNDGGSVPTSMADDVKETPEATEE